MPVVAADQQRPDAGQAAEEGLHRTRQPAVADRLDPPRPRALHEQERAHGRGGPLQRVAALLGGRRAAEGHLRRRSDSRPSRTSRRDRTRALCSSSGRSRRTEGRVVAHVSQGRARATAASAAHGHRGGRRSRSPSGTTTQVAVARRSARESSSSDVSRVPVDEATLEQRQPVGEEARRLLVGDTRASTPAEPDDVLGELLGQPLGELARVVEVAGRQRLVVRSGRRAPPR